MRKYRNRGIGTGGTEAVAAGRIGYGGKRTFHVDFRGVKIGSGTSARGAIDYIAAQGDYEGRDDLEHRAGNVDLVRAACSDIEAGARVKRGPTAERVLVKMVAELPFELDQEQRAAVAENLVQHWAKRSHLAVAAVHHIEGEVNPHVHLAIAARPIMVKDKMVVIDRDPTKRLMVGKAALRSARAEVAELINNVADRDLFHAGTLKEIGIDRPPRKRVPIAVYKAGQHGRDPAAVEAKRKQLVKEKRERAIKRKIQRREEMKSSIRRANKLMSKYGRMVVSERTIEAFKKQVRFLDTARKSAEGQVVSTTPTEIQQSLVIDAHQALGIELPAQWWSDPKMDAEAWKTTREFLNRRQDSRPATGREIDVLRSEAARLGVPNKRLTEILKSKPMTRATFRQISEDLAQIRCAGPENPLSKVLQDRYGLNLFGRPLTKSKGRGGIGS